MKENMNDKIEIRVLNVLSAVMKVDASMSFTKRENQVWDSLKHIELLFALEEEFSIEFEEEIIEGMNSANTISEIVKKKLYDI